jgi:hypothetical protein
MYEFLWLSFVAIKEAYVHIPMSIGFKALLFQSYLFPIPLEILLYKSKEARRFDENKVDTNLFAVSERLIAQLASTKSATKTKSSHRHAVTMVKQYVHVLI